MVEKIEPHEVSVVIYRAPNEPEINDQYLSGHRQVLLDFGIKNVTSSKADWMSNTNAICIAAFNKEMTIIGGIRVEVSSENFLLPIEDAIGKLDKNIFGLIGKSRSKGVGEICGMWTSRNVAGQGIGTILVRLAVFSILFESLQYGTCLVTDYTKKLVERYGFRVMTSIGKEGTFLYPDERYIATVMWWNSDLFQTYTAAEDLRVFKGIFDSGRYIELFQNFQVPVNVKISL